MRKSIAIELHVFKIWFSINIMYNYDIGIDFEYVQNQTLPLMKNIDVKCRPIIPL